MSVGAAPASEVVLGVITTCQGCAEPALEPVLDLGHHPPCDSLVPKEQLAAPETHYPLVFCRCTSCGLAQINYAVEPEVLFFREYPYQTAMTQALTHHFRSLTTEASERLELGEGDLAIDLGSNDGTLLQGFRERGLRVLGVEPTGIAEIAGENGIPTVNAFFDEELAARIVAEHGPAAVVTGTNMLAHVNNLYPELRGVGELIGENGAFVSESHYLLNLVEELQYDTIYHEHLRFYSLRPLKAILERAGLYVFDAQRVPTHGGSIRVWADKGRREPTPRVAELERLEEERGLYEHALFERFRARVVASKHRLLELLLEARKKGRVVGVGAPGRASTLLTYAGIGPDLVDSIMELPGSLKIGQYTPATHIPIVAEEQLLAGQPEHALLLSWHVGEGIVRKLRERGYRGVFVIPLPEPRLSQL